MAELICITGIDGAGKSTLIEKLEAHLTSVKVANIWDIMDGAISEVPFKSKKDIDNYLCELSTDARLLFLAHALKFSIDNAIRSGKENILLNAYYYKYFATELALGANKQLVLSLIKDFPVPDKVIHLAIDINAAANRKKYFSRYECGLSPQPDQSSFLNFQKKAEHYWNTFEMTNWTVLNGMQAEEDIFDQTLLAIQSK